MHVENVRNYSINKNYPSQNKRIISFRENPAQILRQLDFVEDANLINKAHISYARNFIKIFESLNENFQTAQTAINHFKYRLDGKNEIALELHSLTADCTTIPEFGKSKISLAKLDKFLKSRYSSTASIGERIRYILRLTDLEDPDTIKFSKQ